jgi:protein-ribulosamine 3-kinase
MLNSLRVSAAIQTHLAGIISAKLGHDVSSSEFIPQSGGSINDTYQVLVGNGQKYFLKLNSSQEFPGLFLKEKSGVEYLGKQKIFPVPSVIACEDVSDTQLLLLEWINKGERHTAFWGNFGERLARLHRIKNDLFGFFDDNYMGALPQQNTFAKDWVCFFINSRISPLVQLALDKQLLTSKHVISFERLYKKLPVIFDNDGPSLLHGDLWSGNFMCNAEGQPVLIDPAVYYGHRSMDLGMTILFGGFDRKFYEAYHYHYPLPSNHSAQWEVANLYPLLIHLNLFGSGYLSQIEGILKKIT